MLPVLTEIVYLKATVTIAVRTFLAIFSSHADTPDSGSVPNLAPCLYYVIRGNSCIPAIVCTIEHSLSSKLWSSKQLNMPRNPTMTIGRKPQRSFVSRKYDVDKLMSTLTFSRDSGIGPSARLRQKASRRFFERQRSRLKSLMESTKKSIIP